jgi:hypothetical protein
MPAAGTAVKFVVKNGPKIVAALGTVSVFLKNHPEIPAWFREQLDDIPKRISAAQARRTDAARIRGMLDIIRDVAREAEVNEADPSTADAATWIRRADEIELRVRLAEALPRPEQKKTLARLRTETEALLAERIDAVTGAPPVPASDSPSDEPPTREDEPHSRDDEPQTREDEPQTREDEPQTP